MKNLRVAAVLAGILAFFVLPAFAAQSIVESVAVVTDHSGNARIYTQGVWKNAEINMPLYEGDAVKTFSDSSIEVTFDDATIVKLGDNTELKMKELKRQGEKATTIFTLLKGKFMAIVDKLKNPDSRFEVHTKMAIAAVKGTELAVEAGADDTNIGVYHGAVEFTGSNGGQFKGKVMVMMGNESGVGGSGIPGAPNKIKYMGKFEWQFNKLREDIKIVRELKQQGGDAVYKWRIQRKLEKDGKKIGESETEGTIGGTNENVGEVKTKVQNLLKNRLKKELMNERHHAVKDLSFIGKEMKADLHLGKTMTDVHGNRVRLEEFIYRPADNQIDMLTLTLRKGDRLDYLRLQNIFKNRIPEDITRAQWKSMWASEWYMIQPENYLTEQSVKMSNIDDWVFIGTLFGQPVSLAGALPHYVLPKTNEILAFSKMSGPAGGIPMEVIGDMNTENFINEPLNHGFVREHRVYMAPDTDGSQAVKRGALDKTFDTFTDYNNAMFAYYGTNGSIGSNEFVGYSQGNSMAEGVGDGDLAFKHTRNYNDGSVLDMNLYLINDYGMAMRVPDLTKNVFSIVWDLMNIVYNSNVEIMIKSNQFLEVDNGIDVVSKLLWWLILNPQNAENKTPVDYNYSPI